MGRCGEASWRLAFQDLILFSAVFTWRPGLVRATGTARADFGYGNSDDVMKQYTPFVCLDTLVFAVTRASYKYQQGRKVIIFGFGVGFNYFRHQLHTPTTIGPSPSPPGTITTVMIGTVETTGSSQYMELIFQDRLTVFS